MFFFGHTGIAFGAAKKLNPSLSLLVVAGVAMLPDLIDKSIHYVFWPQFTNGNTRTIAHSLLFTAVYSLILFVLEKSTASKKTKWLWLLPWVHLVLDEMWESKMRVSLLWPFLGHDFPPFEHKGAIDHLTRIFKKPQVILGEIIGAWIFYKHYKSTRRESFKIGS
jgi:membrane-bound metal-dependent hydrolase YbcI (DUF457 family)